jgi:hypothetical protein
LLADPPACLNAIGAAAALDENRLAEFRTPHGMIDMPGRSIWQMRCPPIGRT